MFLDSILLKLHVIKNFMGFFITYTSICQYTNNLSKNQKAAGALLLNDIMPIYPCFLIVRYNRYTEN